MKTTTALLMGILLLAGDNKDLFSTKSIEGRMIKIEASLYANKYETTNAEYREFLEWVKANNTQNLEQFSVNHQGWDDYLGEEYSSQYFNRESFDNNPVVNITHEAALEFCAWLTKAYNESGDRKKKFKEVKFRLPTEDEWLIMATGTRKSTPVFPWGTPYMRDRDSHYRANFRRYTNANIKSPINNPKEVEITRRTETRRELLTVGTSIPTKVSAYEPTGAGFYNLAGNAAEMLAEKGRTKGGSWASSGYYLRIQAEDEFKGFISNPYVGFRYVMEVIEE